MSKFKQITLKGFTIDFFSSPIPDTHPQHEKHLLILKTNDNEIRTRCTFTDCKDCPLDPSNNGKGWSCDDYDDYLYKLPFKLLKPKA